MFFLNNTFAPIKVNMKLVISSIWLFSASKQQKVQKQ